MAACSCGQHAAMFCAHIGFRAGGSLLWSSRKKRAPSFARSRPGGGFSLLENANCAETAATTKNTLKPDRQSIDDVEVVGCRWWGRVGGGGLELVRELGRRGGALDTCCPAALRVASLRAVGSLRRQQQGLRPHPTVSVGPEGTLRGEGPRSRSRSLYVAAGRLAVG